MGRAVVFVVALSLAAIASGAPGRASGERARRQTSADGRGQPRDEHQHGDWFFVAVLRSDGVLVPFATYWQGFWLTPWPAPEGTPPETNDLTNLPEAWFAQYEGQTTDWHANGPALRRRLKLRAARAVEVENHCGKNWGLQTDYAGETYKPNEHHRNVGVAASAPVEIVAPVKLDARGQASVTSVIRRRFEEDERTWLARPDFARQAKLFPAAAARARRAPEIKTLYRVDASGGRRLYYFVAERRYPKPRGAEDEACESVSAMTGMLMQAGPGAAPLLVERQFALSDCDGKERGSSGLPLGLVREGKREFLIMEEHGYANEGYTIMEVLDKTFRRLREVTGGGC